MPNQRSRTRQRSFPVERIVSRAEPFVPELHGIGREFRELTVETRRKSSRSCLSGYTCPGRASRPSMTFRLPAERESRKIRRAPHRSCCTSLVQHLAFAKRPGENVVQGITPVLDILPRIHQHVDGHGEWP